MDAKAEQRSLNECPLPPVVIVDPLTRVHECDMEIFRLNQQISDLIRQKTEALDYAVKNDIREDDACYLKENVRKFRTLDIARFREVFPVQFKIACDLERAEKTEALDHIGEKINLTLADKLVKKASLDAAQGVISVKETRSYEVVRK
jgi:hypothetical protein